MTSPQPYSIVQVGKWGLSIPLRWVSSMWPRAVAGSDSRGGLDGLFFDTRLRSETPLDGLLALLVTDLQGFTSMVERLGDARSQAVMHTHNRVLRRCLQLRRGVEVAHTGDGVVAAFRSAAAALQCAAEIQAQFAQHNRSNPETPLHARMGLHAGEPLPEEGRLFGLCINVAVRACAEAPAGGVLVTHVVSQLAQGRFVFGAGRDYALKGFSGLTQLYAFEWQSSSGRAAA